MSTMAAPPLLSGSPVLKKASLYVGDLDPGVSESDLQQVFSIHSIPPYSLRLCRDSFSGKSLCYAYVNFTSHFDAYKALHCLNHTNLKGKPMRIMWSQRDPFARKTSVGNVFVKNLNHSVTSKDLENLFIRYGNILSCKVAEDNGKSKGFGFVQFDLEESANAAIKALNGLDLSGKKMFVCKFVRKNERQATKSTCLYVKNLDQDLTEELVKDKFSKFGKLQFVSIVKDDQGKSKGFGFINFVVPEDAEKALDSMNGLELGSKKIVVEKAQKKSEREQTIRISHGKKMEVSKNVYVKNLDQSIDDKMLEEHFKSFGRITSAKIMRYGNGDSKGFGFVCFSSPDEADKAVAALHQTKFGGKSIYVAIAQRKEDRAVNLQLKHWFPPHHIMPNPVFDASTSEYFYTVGPSRPYHTHETQISSKILQDWLEDEYNQINHIPYGPYVDNTLQTVYGQQGLKPKEFMTGSSTSDLKNYDPAIINSRVKSVPSNKGSRFTGMGHHSSQPSYKGSVPIY